MVVYLCHQRRNHRMRSVPKLSRRRLNGLTAFLRNRGVVSQDFGYRGCGNASGSSDLAHRNGLEWSHETMFVKRGSTPTVEAVSSSRCISESGTTSGRRNVSSANSNTRPTRPERRRHESATPLEGDRGEKPANGSARNRMAAYLRRRTPASGWQSTALPGPAAHGHSPEVIHNNQPPARMSHAICGLFHFNSTKGKSYESHHPAHGRTQTRPCGSGQNHHQTPDALRQ